MPDSPERAISLLPNRPDTKALNRLLKNVASSIVESPKMPSKSKKPTSPTAKKFFTNSSQKKLTGWLSKPTVSQSIIKCEGSKSKKTNDVTPKPLNIYTTKTKKTSINDSENGKKPKTASKPKFKRFDSASSDELPTFKEKTSRKRPRQTESFKKYGVNVPSLDEIVADQTHLKCYKDQVEEAQTLKEPTFKMPLSPKKPTQSEEELLLDCKQLTLKEITDYFTKNIPFLRDIINGKKFSDRHRRYFDKKKKLEILTMEDLTFNTSTIVFTFEQIDHMISLMQTEFDPEDKKTSYFFKVLVPELCFSIFMDIHNMNKREAKRYLENRPVD